MKTLGRWHINTAVNGEFFATLKARNGKTLVVTETEKSRRNVRRTIESVRRNAPGEIRDNTR